MNQRNKHFWQRMGLYLCIGLSFYLYFEWRKETKPTTAETIQPSIPKPNYEPDNHGMPGFDPRELNKPKDEGELRADEALAKLANEPETDMIPPTYYSDMDGQERDSVDVAYDQIMLDTERRTGVSYKQITIEDIYRIDNPNYDPYGMNSYEAYVFVKNKCEIVSFMINYQNAEQLRISGSRPCTNGKVDQSGE